MGSKLAGTAALVTGASRGIGAAVVLPGGPRLDTTLFGEAPSRIVVSLAERDGPQLLALAAEWNVPVTVLGRTGGTRLEISVAEDHRPALELAAFHRQIDILSRHVARHDVKLAAEHFL